MSILTPAIWYNITDHYDQFMATGDQRILGYPMMQAPGPTLSLCLAYLLFVKFVGPKMMANRKPMELRLPMIIYNFAMVLLNGYMFIMFGVHGWFGKYDFRCQPVDMSNSPDAIGMIDIGWLFYFSKFVEFLDTIFFVLRKKNGQITTLHLIHHMTMPFNVWFTIRFAPGGHSSFCSFCNSFVHVVMYGYYGLAALGPHMSPYIWWKRYITKLQMVQFVLVMSHQFQLLFRDCNYPKIFMAYIGLYSVLFLFMFSDFYIKAYKAKAKAIALDKQQQSINRSSPLLANQSTKSTIKLTGNSKNGFLEAAVVKKLM